METSGIGRPSTYASTIGTILNRNYVTKKTIKSTSKQEDVYILEHDDEIKKDQITVKIPEQKNKIVLTDLGIEVHKYLSLHFEKVLSSQYTSMIEEKLDKIAEGKCDWIRFIDDVYENYRPIIESQKKEKRTSVTKKSKGGLEIKEGKYGPYINHNDRNISLTNYMTFSKKKISELTFEDIEYISQYPKKISSTNQKIYVFILVHMEHI